MKIQEETFIELINKKVKYISNYTLYNKDIKKITEIENEISKLNISAYKVNIIDKLEEFNIDSFISLSEKKKFKEKIKNEVELLVNNLKNYKKEKFLTNLDNILAEFNNLISDNKINNIV